MIYRSSAAADGRSSSGAGVDLNKWLNDASFQPSGSPCILILILLQRTMAITISGLFIYPIKSCRGIPVFSAELTALGFKYDRNYMLIEKKEAKPDDKDGLKEDKWIPMTIREHPKVLLPIISAEMHRCC